MSGSPSRRAAASPPPFSYAAFAGAQSNGGLSRVPGAHGIRLVPGTKACPPGAVAALRRYRF